MWLDSYWVSQKAASRAGELLLKAAVVRGRCSLKCGLHFRVAHTKRPKRRGRKAA